MKDGFVLLVIAAMAIASVFSHGSLAQTANKPAVTVITANGAATLTWDASTIGPANIEHSLDLSGWTTIATSNLTGSFQHAFGDTTNGFYQLRWTPSAPPLTPTMITVQGGTLPQDSGFAGVVVGAFEIGKFEVTWEEWLSVRAWAATNGYDDLATAGSATAARYPVGGVTWYDALKWANALSEREGLTPAYYIAGEVYRSGSFGWDGAGLIEVNALASGYRLPTEAEWEWAARGGVSSQGHIYSGGADLALVGWYAANSGGRAMPVGEKMGNELGLHDMSGNLHEWCLCSGPSPPRPPSQTRGGSYGSDAQDCEVASFAQKSGTSPGRLGRIFGFRVARNAP